LLDFPAKTVQLNACGDDSLPCPLVAHGSIVFIPVAVPQEDRNIAIEPINPLPFASYP
jgi:hypothetical protein